MAFGSLGRLTLGRLGASGGGSSGPPELVADSSFDSGVGWLDASLGTAVPSFAGGEVSLPRPDGSNIAIVRQAITTEVGETYRLRSDASVAAIKVGVGNSALDDSLINETIQTDGSLDEDFIATATSTHVYLIGTTNGTTPKSSFVSIKKR